MVSADLSRPSSSALSERLTWLWAMIRVGRDDHFARRALLWVGIPFGLLIVFFVPPTQVVDESAHFLRTWQLAGLNLFTDPQVDPVSEETRNGSIFDTCVIEYIDGFEAVAATQDDFRVGDFWFDTPDCSPQRRAWAVTDAGTNYGPWSYPGQFAGLTFARAVGLPLPVAFFLGRLAGLAVYLATVFAALRIAPAGRLTMLFVALLPMSMLTAAAYSADGMIIAGSMLAIACALRLQLDPDAKVRTLFALMWISVLCIVVSKPAYVVFVALFALVPTHRDESLRRARWWILGAAVSVVMLAAVWYRISQGESDHVFYEDTNAGSQLDDLIDDPLDFFDLLWNTLNSYTYEVWFFRGWTGVFGMFRVRDGVSVLLGLPYAVFAAVVAGLTVLVEAGRRRVVTLYELLTRASVAWTILVLGPLLLFVAAFLLWTRVGGDIIIDVHGRYMLPFVPVAAAAIALFRERSTMAISPRLVALANVVLALAALDVIRTLFY